MFYFLLCIIYLTYDSFNQLEQALTGVFTPGHPFLHTFLEFLLIKIWNTPAVIALFQILVFSLIWTFICSYNRKKMKQKSLYILQLLITFIVCLSPLNAVSSITLWKDILFSYLLILFSFSIQIFIEQKENISNKTIYWSSITLALIPCLRFNGLAIFCIFIIFMPCMIYKYTKNVRKIATYLFISIILFLGIQGISKMVVKEKNTNDGTSLLTIKSLQLTGYFNDTNIFTDEQKNVIFNYIDENDLENKYNLYFTDPLGSIKVDHETFSENNKLLYNTLIKVAFKNPLKFSKFVFYSSSIIWLVDFPEDMMGTLLTTGYDAENNTRRILQTHREEKVYKQYNKLIDFTMNHKIIKIALYTPALYFYISVILTLGIVWMSKKKSYLYLLLPNFINMLALTISIPLQDLRYNYASILILYFIIMIFIRIFYLYINEHSKKTNNKKKVTYKQ